MNEIQFLFENRNLKAAREKWLVMQKGSSIRLTPDFSSETMEDIIKKVKDNEIKNGSICKSYLVRA